MYGTLYKGTVVLLKTGTNIDTTNNTNTNTNNNNIIETQGKMYVESKIEFLFYNMH